ncbi:FAD dependent oxidoreductase [Cordyceps fumosorosea ARSEF 2679]|uniref:FAD dependent oxidoreductase n=1 Tax=Cordyceps fumosorosea (strain ARSEF 2679) TaxID=1081104 RepID=A0A168ESB9_CORFA|nr:FAD dependent oxidoreductase [Cordyceps fumosorosea ARSEF 2679]OAA74153.1 FAD dependent oxidoreductase [Cordyceps fumosorosea ARSEF 2679]
MTTAPPAPDSEPALSADCIVVGAGFSGCYATHMLRRQGYTVKMIDAGSDFGGVWHSHRYPGALVDSPSPLYQLSLPEAWRGFHFRTKFPDQREMQAYFRHVADVLDLRCDALFRHVIVDARYDNGAGVWQLRSDRGLRATGRYVFFATGTTNKPYVPAFPGLERFRGQLVHTHDWPADLSLKEARRIALIGTGSTGTQVAQEIAKLDADVTVFTRTPNIAYPLRQETRTLADAERRKAVYGEVFPQAKAAGWPRYLINTPARPFREDTPARHREVWEAAWRKGGFAVFLENYPEVATDKAVNAAFYEFWKEKTGPRIRDPAKRAALVPDEQPVWFMARRPVLEDDYYEMMDRDNVTLVDLRRTPIKEFTADGIVTADGEGEAGETLREFDLVICATGYDSVTGSLHDMNVRDRHGVFLQDKWRDGIATHMGMMVPGLPNAFLLYGPQAPGPMTNGPTFIEVQVELLCRLLARAEGRGLAELEATEEAARRWRDKVYEGYRATLASEVDSWWVGTNVPGKRREPLTWFAGVPAWREACEESLRSWDDFEPARVDAKL